MSYLRPPPELRPLLPELRPDDPELEEALLLGAE